MNLADVDDILYVYKPTSFSYATKQGDYTLVKIEGLLDGTSLFDPDNPTKIVLDPKKFQEGNHVLKIEATFLSYSGTLASQIGQEYETLSKEYNLVIDLTAPQPVKIKKFTVKDGTFYVTWEAPEKKNFTHYKVRRYSKYGDQWSEYQNTSLVNNDVLVFKDSLYFGSDIKYQIDLVGYTFDVAGIPSDTIVKPTIMTIKQTGDNTRELTWTKSPLYSNIANILVTKDWSNIYTTYPNEAGAISLQLPFGETPTYSAYTTSPYGEQQGNFFSTMVYVGRRLEFKGLGETLVKTPEWFGSQEILINFDRNTPKEVYFVNSQTLTIERKIDLSGYLTNKGSGGTGYGTTPDGSKFYLFVNENIYQFDKDFNLIKTISIPEMTPSVFAYQIRVSNPGVAVLDTRLHGAVVVNLETGEIIQNNIPDYAYNMGLSPDGKYYIQKGDVYAITGNTPSYVATIPDAANARVLSFKPNDPQVLIAYGDGTVGRYDLPSQSLVTRFDLPDYRVTNFSYDPITGLCGGYHGTYPDIEYFVFDVDTKAIQRTFKVTGDYYQLYNNTVYASNGLAFPL